MPGTAVGKLVTAEDASFDGGTSQDASADAADGHDSCSTTSDVTAKKVVRLGGHFGRTQSPPPD